MVSTKMVLVAGIFAIVAVLAAGFIFNDSGSTTEADILDADILEYGTYDKTVKAGEEFTISMKANPTTGYQWKADAGDAIIVDEKYVVDQGREGLCGAGGIQYYTLKCDSPGVYKVVLDYQRSWEGSEGNVIVLNLNVE